MEKAPQAFRTIGEASEWLGVQPHVLRFWESRFSQVRPVKRRGGRRYYRPEDLRLLAGIRHLLHEEGMTIRGVQKLLREKGVAHVASLADPALVARLEGRSGTGSEADDRNITAAAARGGAGETAAAPLHEGKVAPTSDAAERGDGALAGASGQAAGETAAVGGVTGAPGQAAEGEGAAEGAADAGPMAAASSSAGSEGQRPGQEPPASMMKGTPAPSGIETAAGAETDETARGVAASAERMAEEGATTADPAANVAGEAPAAAPKDEPAAAEAQQPVMRADVPEGALLETGKGAPDGEDGATTVEKIEAKETGRAGPAGEAGEAPPPAQEPSSAAGAMAGAASEAAGSDRAARGDDLALPVGDRTGAAGAPGDAMEAGGGGRDSAPQAAAPAAEDMPAARSAAEELEIMPGKEAAVAGAGAKTPPTGEGERLVILFGQLETLRARMVAEHRRIEAWLGDFGS